VQLKVLLEEYLSQRSAIHGSQGECFIKSSYDKKNENSVRMSPVKLAYLRGLNFLGGKHAFHSLELLCLVY
jgi:hypothetical protein